MMSVALFHPVQSISDLLRKLVMPILILVSKLILCPNKFYGVAELFLKTYSYNRKDCHTEKFRAKQGIP